MNDSHSASPVLELCDLSKSFEGVQALHDVSLTVLSGEIHGLLGQNGSGKSTLIKVLAGFHEPDAGGQLLIDGEQVALPLAPGEFQALGMRFVHQDLGLIHSLSVLDNLNIADWSTTPAWRISYREARAGARELFARFGLSLDPNARVGDLRPVERALLAIVRAVSTMPSSADSHRGLLVLDEPTVFLPDDDTQLLFEVTRQIAASGAGVLFVSHDLDEVLALTDRVTVLRDGRNAGTRDTAEATAPDLVELIVGHAVTTGRPAAASGSMRDRVLVDVTGVAGGLVRSADLHVRAGEIVGVTGLSGAGFEDLPYLLFGVGLATGGQMQIGDRTVQLDRLNPLQASRAGIALVPADRQRDGAILSLPVADNLGMQILHRARRGPHLRRRKLRTLAQEALGEFDVRPANPDLPCSALSGGNQQKVLMAKWLQTKPDFLILHEPTQGVDVGAREEIYRVIRDAAAAGVGVLCASSDHEQLASLCDRVVVFRQGRVGVELRGAEVTKHHISQACFSVPDDAPATQANLPATDNDTPSSSEATPPKYATTSADRGKETA